MQMNESYLRQREWGDKPCGHPAIEPESISGSHR